MSLILKFAGRQRSALVRLLVSLDELAHGGDDFSPGCGLDEEETLRIDAAKAVVQSLLDARVRLAPESKAGGLASGKGGE